MNKGPVVRTEKAGDNKGELGGERFHPSVYISETAVIDEGVEIGEGTKIWNFTHVCAFAKIGKGVTIGEGVYVGPEVEIGDHCKIQNRCELVEGVLLEENVFLGAGVIFTNVSNPRAFINRRHAFKHTAIGKSVTIGANVTLTCGVSIGRYAFIEAGSVVERDVDAFSLERGMPAMHVGWVSMEGVYQRNRPGM